MSGGNKMRKCPGCGYFSAIMWNPYNMVIQCHNCGHVIEETDLGCPVWESEQDEGNNEKSQKP